MAEGTFELQQYSIHSVLITDDIATNKIEDAKDRHKLCLWFWSQPLSVVEIYLEGNSENYGGSVMWRTFGNVIKLWDSCAPLSRSASLSAGDMAYGEETQSSTCNNNNIVTRLLYFIMTRQLGETISVNGGAEK